MLKAFADGRLFGTRTGAGAPWVLALHGWGRTHADFARVLGPAAAADPLAAVALDLPGFGATPAPSQAWGSAEYAGAVQPVLAAMAAEAGRPVVVLGHSVGGQVAVQLAWANPELVGALVLCGVPRLAGGDGGGRRPKPLFRVGRILNRRGLLGDGAMEALRRRYGSTDYRRASGIMREVLVRMVNERYPERVAGLGGPVELVWGSQDAVVPLAVAQAALALLGDRAILTVSPGVGHLLPTEDPDGLRRVLERHR